MLKILIADDQTLLREGLQTIIDLEDDMEVVGFAENGYEAYEKVQQLRPDIVLMDIKMPEMDGIESTKYILNQYPDTIILILTTFADDDYIVDGLVNGAKGFLLKDMNYDQLLSTIRDAVSGNMILPHTVAVKLAARLSGYKKDKKNAVRPNQKDIHFSERESQIASCMIQGMTNREIADHLNITEGTVKNYISDIYRKIDIHDRAKAVLFLSNLVNCP